MSTSYLYLGNKGFWSQDTLIEVFAFFLAQELKETYKHEWAVSYAEHLKKISTSGMIGCIDLELDALPKERKNILVDSSSQILDKVMNNTGLLSAVSLNMRLIGGGRFTSDINSLYLISFISVFQKLLKGEWKWDESNPESLPSHWQQLRDKYSGK